MTHVALLSTSPTHAQIDPTSVCDLDCGFCVGRDWRQGHLPAELFAQALEQLPDLIYVQLQGEGEPMLSKRFWPYLKALRDRQIDVGFITNGRHLTSEAVYQLVEAGVRTVTVSIDTLDPEGYFELRRGDLNTALAGLRELASHRTPGMDVFVASILTRQTFGRFPEVIELSSDLGLSLPSCQELQQKESYTSHYRGLSIGSHGLSDQQRAWMRTYQRGRSELRVQNNLVSFWESVVATEPAIRCPFVATSIHIRFDGHIFPCCFVKEDEFSLGRLPGDDLQGDAVSNARNLMLSQIEGGGTPAPCIGCHVLSR